MVISTFEILIAASIIGWLLAVILGVLALHRGGRARVLSATVGRHRETLAAQEGQLAEAAHLREAVSELRAERDALKGQEASLLTRIEERERHARETRLQMENEFRTMAGKLVREAGDTLLRDAKQTFEKQHVTVRADAETYSKSVSELLRPMRETLGRYEEGLKDLRAYQAKAQGELSGQINTLARSASAVQAEARGLSAALKAGPKTRGRWGETTLRNVIELAGLSAHADFAEQYSVTDEANNRKLPDLVVRLPSDRMVAVDSKVPLTGWLDVANADDETTQDDAAAAHGKAVWNHVMALSAKDYAGALKKENALDIVIMFMPGETFFTAALEARPTLFEDAYGRGVLIATPTTLIAILKSIAHAWRQQNANDSASAVADMASDLYDSLRKTGSLLADLGKNLDRSVTSYNSLVGNLETRVLPRARRFAAYEMPGTEKPVAEIQQSEADVRLPSETKDFEFTPALASSAS